MEDPRTAQGVEHLQSAARELLRAARSFLDVVEDVVEDPEKLTGAAAGLTDLVAGAFGRRPQPWEAAAWDDEDPDADLDADLDADPAPAPGATASATATRHGDTDEELWGPEEDDDASERGPAPVVTASRRTEGAARRRATPRSTTARTAPSRVRRITVE
ncbi:MAG: hypothetical protein ACYC2O_13415 [Microthrixaceae bacterium]